METSRPLSARLNRGTLLMTHSPSVRLRFVSAAKAIRAESLALIVGGLLIVIGGLLVEETIIAVVGLAIVATGLGAWLLRASFILWRRARVPSLLFVSGDGIGAILPDSSAVHLPWGSVLVRTVNYARIATPLGDRPVGVREEGLLLMERGGRKVYITRELSGFEELIAILKDYGIPIVDGSFFGDGGASRQWRGGLELSPGGFSN